MKTTHLAHKVLACFLLLTLLIVGGPDEKRPDRQELQHAKSIYAPMYKFAPHEINIQHLMIFIV